MPSIDEWFTVYKNIQDNLGAVNGSVAGVLDKLDSIQAQLRDTTNPDINGIAESLVSIASKLATLDLTLKVDLLPLVTAIGTQFSAGENTFGTEFSLKLGSLIRRLGTEELPINVPLYDMVGTLQEALADPNSPISKGMTSLEKLAAEILKEESPNLLSALRAILAAMSKHPLLAAGALATATVAVDVKVLEEIRAFLRQTLEEGLALFLEEVRPVVNVAAVPFLSIVRAAMNEYTADLEASAPADPSKVRALAGDQLVKALTMGQSAHFLALAGEVFPITKQLGFPQAAAAMVDLAGFREISGTIARATLGAAITRPMRWWGNMTFTPEIPNPRDLIELVQKREIDLETYAGFLQMHGFRQEDIDLFTRAVWREPTLRDLGVVIDDVSVDDTFLAKRVRRAGYADDDAEKLTGALIQRIIKSSRATLISAARGAVADGALDQDAFRTMLDGMGLREDIIGFETRAADMQARRDYVRDAIATYRRQYVNDVITEGDFAITLAALGVAPDRADLILADANAARAPRIAREEERAIEEAVREIQREIVPRYRRLFELGAIDEAQYQAILIDAGISPAVAGQAVILDRQKRDLIAQKSGSIAFEREVDRLVNETEEALRLQFRKGLLDLEGLGAQLTNLGIPPARVKALQDQERSRAIKPPGRPIPTPEEAKTRALSDLAVQTALNDFRRGDIGPGDLFGILVEQGQDPDVALARVDLEISRLPSSRAPSTSPT